MNAVLSIVMLAAFALLAGGFWLWRKGGSQKQAGLMLLLAVVMIVNVLIWTIPSDDGAAAPGMADADSAAEQDR